jgi:hypothetical protein
MIKCSECGYENIDGLDYCDGCGAKLTAAAAPAPAGENGGAAPSEPPTGEIKPPHETAAPAMAAEAPAAPEASAKEAPAAAAESSSRAKLQVVRGGRKGQEFPLEDGNNLVGRWDPETGSFPEVDLDQDDPEAKISRKHALIRFEAGKITVEDIGSLNGTYVNRQPRLMPGNPVELKSGDEIIIGKTFLKLVVDPVS